MELYKALELAKKELNTSISEMLEWGIKKAEAEHDYKIVLNQEVLKMKSEGQAVGIIDKTCYGTEVVANARLNRDIAETKYEVAKEKVNASKLNVRTIDAQMSREWSNI